MRKKQYHHKESSGGYRTGIPKWDKMKEDLLAKGIAPQSLDWPERAKRWFFAHGGKLDPEIGVSICAGALAVPAQRLLEILDASASGVSHPVLKTKPDIHYM
jgi:hypothetical protein